MHDGGELGQSRFALDHHSQHLESTQDAIAGGHVVAENKVARVFTAE